MNYEELVKKAKQATKKMDVSTINEHIAVQIDVVGEGEGAFYVEVADGKVSVEPYEYYDNDCKVTASADVISALFAGKLNVDEALANGSVSVEGDGGKALAIVNALKVAPEKKSAAAKKPAAKKAPVKKTAAKKTTAKKTTKK